MANGGLRGCPTCLTRVSDVQLGLRDYRWLGNKLPGRVAPMDGDFILEKNGRFLVLEFKPPGGGLGLGARITYKAMVRTGLFDVWVVNGDGPMVEVGAMDRFGDVKFVARVSVDTLGDKVADWYAAAEKEK